MMNGAPQSILFTCYRNYLFYNEETKIKLAENLIL